MSHPDNHKRQLEAHRLWRAAKIERAKGNREEADRLKHTGNALVNENWRQNNPSIVAKQR